MEIDKIWCEDCLEGMKRIPDGAVDCIITDPPFQCTNNFWDKRIPIEPMWEQFKRVTKHNAAILIFAQMKFAVDLINANRKMFRYDIVWHKTNPVGFLNANKMPLRAHEFILVFYRKLPTYNPQYWYSTPYHNKIKAGSWQKLANCYNSEHFVKTPSSSYDGRRNPLDVVKYSPPPERSNSRVTVEHSTQKPVGLLEYLVKTYSNEGELVLDSCMGSGTTAVACVNTNRHFVGFETHQPYVDICNRRIAEARDKLHRSQQELF